MLKETLPWIQGYLDYKTHIEDAWPWIIIGLLIFVPVVGSPAQPKHNPSLGLSSRYYLKPQLNLLLWN